MNKGLAVAKYLIVDEPEQLVRIQTLIDRMPVFKRGQSLSESAVFRVAAFDLIRGKADLCAFWEQVAKLVVLYRRPLRSLNVLCFRKRSRFWLYR